MEKELIKSPLYVLNKLGYLVPNSLKHVLIKIGITFVFCFVLSLGFVQYFYVENGIFDILDNTTLISGVGQVFIKILLTMFNDNKMLTLIKLSDNFWDSNKCTKNTKRKVDKILATVIIVQKLFLYSLFFAWLLMLLLICLTDQKVPVGIWAMTEYKNLYKIALPSYWLGIILADVLSYCIEGMFLGFCYEIVVQFKILCDHLERLNVEEIESEEDLNNFYSQIKVYVRHHRFLCRFTNLFQDFYSSIFMVQYLSSVVLICSFFYGTLESTKVGTAFKSILISFLLICQLAFYCIPLATLSYEITSVSNAIYNSNWYTKHHLKLKKATLFILQEAQQEIRFTALGLAEMNPRRLVTVLQLAFSTATFFRKVE